MGCQTHSASPTNPKLASRNYTLATMTCQMPFSYLHVLIKHPGVFPLNITATLDPQLRFCLTSKRLLLSTSEENIFESCRKNQIPTSLRLPKRNLCSPKFNQISLPLHLVEYFRGWTRGRSEPKGNSKKKDIDESQWVFINGKKEMLKWKCVSFLLPHVLSFEVFGDCGVVGSCRDRTDVKVRMR
jgi:hypothetical protein